MQELLAADAVLREWVVHHRLQALDSFMLAMSAVGRGGIIWLLIAAALAALRRITPSGLVYVACAILLASLLADRVLKPAIHRERPFARSSAVVVMGSRPGDASFPSGHSANAFAGAAALSVLVPSAWPLWCVLAVAIGYSRVYLGVHYPLDVAAGAVVGAVCAVIAKAIVGRFQEGPKR